MRKIILSFLGVLLISTSIFAYSDETEKKCTIIYDECVSNQNDDSVDQYFDCQKLYKDCLVSGDIEPNITDPPIVPIIRNGGTSLLKNAVDKYGTRDNAINVFNSIKETKANHPSNETKMFFWKNSNKIDICYKLNNTTYKIDETIKLK